MTAENASAMPGLEQSGDSASVVPKGPAKRKFRFGIKAELLVAFGAMTVMTIVASTVAWFAFIEVDRAVTRITASAVPSISRAHALAAEVAEIAASAPVLMASANQDGRTQARRALAAAEEKINALLRELSSVGVGPEAIIELRVLQNEIATNLSSLNTLVESRLTLGTRKRAALERLAATHRQVLETLEPIIDDAVFDTIIISEKISASSADRMSRLVDGGVARAQHLLEIKAEVNYTAGLLAHVAFTPDRDLIQPLFERFESSAYAIARNLEALKEAPEKGRVLRQVRGLLAFGRGADSLFDVRRRELSDLIGDGSMRENSGQANAVTAAALADEVKNVHEQLLLTLTTVVDDAIFDVVISSEKTVREGQAAVTGLVDDGVEKLRGLLTMRAEVNLVAGLLNEASGVSDKRMLGPLRERFVAARSRIMRTLSRHEITELDQVAYALVGFGSDSGNMFDLRYDELEQYAAAESALRDGNEIAGRFGDVTRSLVDGAQATTTSDGFRAQDAIGSGRFLLLLVIAATVSGAVSIIVFYVSPRVVQPLVDMTSALVRLAAGDKTIELPAQDRKDEVGDMALAFKVFKDTAQARTNLSRYFSPKLVEELSKHDQPLGPVRRQNVAVLFADIVGFTQISENQPPEMTMALLREFHKRMEEQVFAHNGVMEKFIGDALLATFGVPYPGEHDAVDALRCGHGMLESLSRWNAERTEVGEQPVRVGIGVNYGPAVLGDIGSERNMAFAVIGDTTNTASRLEGLTRTLGCDIVASAAFVDAVRRQASEDAETLLAGYRHGGSYALRGRKKEVPVWTFSGAEA
jgi:class 3 adenylate cyclase